MWFKSNTLNYLLVSREAAYCLVCKTLLLKGCFNTSISLRNNETVLQLNLLMLISRLIEKLFLSRVEENWF